MIPAAGSAVPVLDQISAAVRSFVEAGATVFNWIGVRWNLAAEPELWMVLTGVGLIAITLAVPVLWHTARNAVTVIHEMGHVIVAMLCGRQIDGIKLHSDTSGLAVTRGRPDGIGMLFTAIAGYPAPGVIGAGMVYAATTGSPGAALLFLVLLLGLALLLVRNIWGLLVAVLALGSAGLVLWQADAVVVTAVMMVLGLFLATGSVRAAGDLWRSHLTGEATASDAHQAAECSFIPTWLWLIFFFVVTTICAVASLTMAGAVVFAAFE